MQQRRPTHGHAQRQQPHVHAQHRPPRRHLAAPPVRVPEILARQRARALARHDDEGVHRRPQPQIHRAQAVVGLEQQQQWPRHARQDVADLLRVLARVVCRFALGLPHRLLPPRVVVQRLHGRVAHLVPRLGGQHGREQAVQLARSHLLRAALDLHHVPLHQRLPQPSVLQSERRVDLAVQSVVEEHDLRPHALGAQPGPGLYLADQHVPCMGVAVDKAVPEDHGVERLGQQASHVAGLQPSLAHGRDIVHVRALFETHHQHPRRGELPQHLGHRNVCTMCEHAPATLHVLPLQSEVELAGQVGLDLIHKPLVIKTWIQPMQYPHQRLHRHQISPTRLPQPRMLHLDRHLTPIPQPRPVHLSKRSAGDGRLLEGVEHLIQPQAELLHERAPHFFATADGCFT
mmetsp:Transcript_22367/g.71979  ORF Transcript_22367/g.71979 Transcript_22367/m.71979 type:complete len:402 (+) Transcript_22367:595-1800(+)